MTAPLAVDPPALAATGGTVSGDGDSIAAAVGSLSSALSGAGALFGHDAAGLVFGQGYTASGTALLDAVASAVNACRNVGSGVQMSAYNYGRANARSTVGGASESPVPAPTAPDKFDAPGMPPPLGSGIAAPLGWSLVEAFVGEVWPDGNPGQMHAAAGAWRCFGASMTGLAAQVAATAPALASQQIPEAGQMAGAVGKICAALANIAVQAQTLATAVEGFAATVEATQNAVRGLLHQLSPGGILETVGGIFTGQDPMEKIREVANEIKTVLNNMKREADASSKLFSQGINLLDSETNSLESWAHKEFVQAFGQPVGDALSFGFTAVVDQTEGGFKFLAQTAESLQQLDPTRFVYDPSGATKSWEGMLETTSELANPALLASKIASDPQGSLDTLKGLVDYQDVENGHLFRALGYNEAQLASLAIPGVGEADPAIAAAGVETRAAAAEAGAEGRVAAGTARDAAAPAAAGARSATESVTTQAGRISNDLNNIKVPESSAPTAAPGSSAPGGRAPVEPPVETPRPETPAPAGRAPVDSAPPVETPHAETPGPATSQPHTPVDTAPPVEARVPTVDAASQPHGPVDTTPPVESRVPTGEAPRPEAPTPAAVEPPSASPPPHSFSDGPTANPAGAEPDLPPQSAAVQPPHATEYHGPDEGRPVWQNNNHVSPGDGAHDPSQPEHDPVRPDDGSGAPGDDGTGPDGRIKFSGHGSYNPADGEVVVPQGSTVTIYGEHGSKITDALGNLIETGGDASHVYSRTFHSREPMPDYTLHPPHGLDVQGTPYTVAEPTKLSQILSENMGDIDFAACVYDGASPTNMVYDVDGIYDEVQGTYTHIYERPSEPDLWDDSDVGDDLISENSGVFNYYEVDQSGYTNPGNWNYDDIDFDEF